MSKKRTGKKIIAGLLVTTIMAGTGVAAGMAIQNAYGKPTEDNTQTEAPAVDYEKLELQNQITKLEQQLATEKENVESLGNELAHSVQGTDFFNFLEDTGFTLKELSNGDYLVTHLRAVKTGIWHITKNNLKINQLHNTGYDWDFEELPNGNVLCYSLFEDGILLYSAETKTISLVYESGRWNYCKKLINNDYLFNCTQPWTEGILLYSAEINTFSIIYDEGYFWNIYSELSNGDLIISSSTTEGILIYSAETKTITPIYEVGKSWYLIKEDVQGVTITSNYNGTVSVYYNFETGECTPIAA